MVASADCGPFREPSRKASLSSLPGSSRQRLQGGLVHRVNGCRGDAQLGGDRDNRVLDDVEVYPDVGGEVWADVALVVSLNFITGQPAEERGDVAYGQPWMDKGTPLKKILVMSYPAANLAILSE
jgi:hypothetical protein